MTGPPAPAPDGPFPLLIDTHVLIWLVLGEPMLGSQARKAIDAATSEDRLFVSAITVWEIALLVSKGRVALPKDVLEWIETILAPPGVQLVGLSAEIAISSTRLPWEMHGDPADRILAATARHLGATLVTADEALLKMAGMGHFRALDAGR